jgi:hypothetical protein
MGVTNKLLVTFKKNETKFMMPELNPGEQLRRLLRSWWIIALCMVVFGAVGYLVHTFRQPVYEATARYEVWIDFNYLKTTREFTEYNEDLSINAVGNSYVAPAVIQQVTDEAMKQAWMKAANELFLNYRLERKHSTWELRYKSANPQVAMSMVNYWVQAGYQHLLELQKTEKIPTYVRFSEPTLAVLPAAPVRFGRNNFVLAGALFGLVVGIFLSGGLSGKKK